eukprot:SAG11_NODE_949_length_6408_cov_16.986210_4_plen_204_part_00
MLHFLCIGKWAPTVDGVELPAHPYALAERGSRARVPLLLGTNRCVRWQASLHCCDATTHALVPRRAHRDEDVSFVGQSSGPLYWNMTGADFKRWASKQYNLTDAQADELAALYPASDFPRTRDPEQLPYSPSWWGAIRAATDQDMTCCTKRGARWFANRSAGGRGGVWLYHFTRPRNGSVLCVQTTRPAPTLQHHRTHAATLY